MDRRRLNPSGVSLARPDLHVFLFGGRACPDRSGTEQRFSIGGFASPARTHLEYGARKNVNLLRHDVTDELAAYKLAQLTFPGVFGVFYQNDRPTKNALEKK